MSRSNFIFEQRTEENKEPCVYVQGRGDNSKVNISDRYAGLEVSLMCLRRRKELMLLRDLVGEGD